MRKTIFLLGLILLVVTSTFCIADENMFSNMTDSELIDALGCLEVEMSSRGINKDNLIFSGLYIVGDDIKPGTYIFTSVDPDLPFYYGLYDSKDVYDRLMEYKNTIPEFIIPCVSVRQGEFTRRILEDGNVLYVHYGIAKIEAQDPDWAP